MTIAPEYFKGPLKGVVNYYNLEIYTFNETEDFINYWSFGERIAFYYSHTFDEIFGELKVNRL
jgi:hypothetical protein